MSNPLRAPLSAGNKSAAPTKTVEVDKPATPSLWHKELFGFLNKRVCVRYVVGSTEREMEGILKAVEWHSVHCIVASDTETVMIRLPLEITLRRGEPKS